MEEVDKGCLMIRMDVSGCLFWYRLTWVVLEKGPLNGCVCACVCVKSQCQQEVHGCSVMCHIQVINH